MKKRVLAIDDEPGILRFISISLKAAGFEVAASSDGEEGLKLAKEFNPDIMLLDVLMSPLSGFDVIEKLREFSQIPVLAFSAKRDVCQPMIEAGAYDCLDKPFMPEQLIRKISEILEEPSAS